MADFGYIRRRDTELVVHIFDSRVERFQCIQQGIQALQGFLMGFDDDEI